MEPHIGWDRDLCLPYLHSTPSLGGGVPVGILKWRLVWRENYNGLAIRWWKKSTDTVTRFDRIHERDRQTDMHADKQTPHDGIGPACTSSRRESSWPRRFERRNKCQQFNSALHGVRPTDASIFTKRVDVSMETGIAPLLCSRCVGEKYMEQWVYTSVSFSSRNILTFCRAMLCISAAIAGMRCPSVRPSVRLSVCHVRELRQKE